MTGLGALIRRNCKLFFKDKGMFFTSLITPVILLVLYATFLAKVYRDSFAAAMPAGFAVDAALIDGTISGARRDLTMTPVRRSTLALGYFAASALSTLLICYAALAVCLGYLAVTGWYLSAADVLLLGLDVLLLSLFGTALSSIVNCNLTTNGQASAVGTIVSAGYGFLCGAYMPISNFGEGLQRVLSFLPGTYGTALFRNHALRGVYAEMTRTGFPAEVVEHIKDSIDCNLYFFGSKVSIGAMTGVMAGSVAVLIGIYILMNLLKKTD